MRIAIVGLGLIGGSLALKLTEQGYAVFGISRNLMTCEQALALGAVQACGTELAQLQAWDPQLVLICTPLEQVLPTLTALLPYLSAETVVSDVGSVKQPIVRPATQLWPLFVGGHPMAGKTTQGIQSAEADLFVGRPYVLTPIAETRPQTLEILQELVAVVGAEGVFTDPARHDRAVAWISHLPVMISASLITSVSQEVDPVILELARTLASSGFRDTSRVGGGIPQLGLEMARHNRQAVLANLRSYQQHLQQIETWIEKEQWDGLSQFLEQTQREWRQFPVNQPQP
ncbi:prephenate/arogenate dehydrogenase [Synechococcus sp. Nb3U1]|uniref:prephenate/arogenate dehydrogenase n=1 Tax=Synechococcus sp. Nb3U1 TaxID=1914529 RepID=UPI001F3A3A85|nr:prephenate/arogenate dehydrogenase [Synechococcus sp. Nb3U1]MCF2972334.1 prephenate/arogenate dehydrogenase [Synechococcus sp. Nb3U1]